MARKNDISEELQGISPAVAGIPSATPYLAPEDYFDRFAAGILQHIKAQENGAATEIRQLSPLLASLKKNMPYSLPSGYFESLEPRTIQSNGRLITGSFGRKAWRVAAAAAVVTGLVFFASWFWSGKNVSDPGQLAQVPDSIVQKQWQQQVREISDSEMADFAEGITAFNYDNTQGAKEINDEDVRLLLADISDSELEIFLQQDDSIKEKLN